MKKTILILTIVMLILVSFRSNADPIAGVGIGIGFGTVQQNSTNSGLGSIDNTGSGQSNTNSDVSRSNGQNNDPGNNNGNDQDNGSDNNNGNDNDENLGLDNNNNDQDNGSDNNNGNDPISRNDDLSDKSNDIDNNQKNNSIKIDDKINNQENKGNDITGKVIQTKETDNVEKKKDFIKENTNNIIKEKEIITENSEPNQMIKLKLESKQMMKFNQMSPEEINYELDEQLSSVNSEIIEKISENDNIKDYVIDNVVLRKQAKDRTIKLSKIRLKKSEIEIAIKSVVQVKEKAMISIQSMNDDFLKIIYDISVSGSVQEKENMKTQITEFEKIIETKENPEPEFSEQDIRALLNQGASLEELAKSILN